MNKESGILLVVFLLVFFSIKPIWVFATDDAEVIQVKEKTTKRNGPDDRYLVFTKNETFEVTDSFWHWRYDSSDDYGKLESNKCYIVQTYGMRIPFLSWYKNIYALEEANCRQ